MAPRYRSNRHRDCPILADLLLRQGRRELAIAHAFASGIRFAPTLDNKQLLAAHCCEELEHLEHAANLYYDVSGRDLFAELETEQWPAPLSWAEAVIAGFLLDQANYEELRSRAASADAIIANLACRLLGEEQDHVAANEATLRELVTADKADVLVLQRHVDRWFPLAFGMLDPVEIENGCGVPHVDATANRDAIDGFLTSVARVLTPIGLRGGPPSAPAA